MGKLVLYCIPAGGSGTDLLLAEAARKEYGTTLFVASSRELVNKAREHHVNAANFEYLVNEVLRRLGPEKGQRQLISRKTQELIVEKLLAELLRQEDGKAACFKALAGEKSFLAALVSLISQLGRAHVTREQLQAAFGNWDAKGGTGLPRPRELRSKDDAVCAVYEAYCAYMEGKHGKHGEMRLYDLEMLYGEALAVLRSLTEAEAAEKLPWKDICFAGFYQFDGLSREIILALRRWCNVVVALPGERVAAGEDYRRSVFAAAEDTFADLSGKSDFLEYVTALQGGREPALDFLLRNFRRPLRDSEKVPGGGVLRIWKAADALTELRLVLRDVKRSILAGTEPRQIAIVVRRLAAYGGLRRGCDAYGIPARFPETAALAASPVLNYAKAFLAGLDGTGRRQAEALARFLLLPVQKLMWNVNTETVKESLRTRYETDAAALFAAAVLPDEAEWLRTCWQDGQSVRTVEAYCDLIRRLCDERRWLPRAGRLYKEGGITLEAFQNLTGGCRAIGEALDHIRNDYDSCGSIQRKMAPAEFSALLAETATELQITLQSGKKDGVVILEASNLEEQAYDKVYVLGMLEGVFPYTKQENWIYSDQERLDLKAMGIDLPGTAQSYHDDVHFFLSACAAARKELTFMYYQDDRQPASPYLAEVRDLFTDFPNPGGEMEVPDTPDAALCPAELALAEALHRLPVPDLDPARGTLLNKALRDCVKAVIGNVFSATKLETYVKCPFHFLARYVWQLPEETAVDEELDALAVGSLIHKSLQLFVGKHLGELNLDAEGRGLDVTQEEALWQELDGIFTEQCDALECKGKVHDGPFWKAQKEGRRQVLQTWLHAELQYRVKGLRKPTKKDPSNFYLVPVGTEIDFKKQRIPLSTEAGDIELEGKIDRADVTVPLDAGRPVPKLIYLTDYKTGSAPKTADFLNRNLQMPIYLYATRVLLKDTAKGLYKAARKMTGTDQPDICGGGYYEVKAKESRRTNHFRFGNCQDINPGSAKSTGTVWSAEGTEEAVLVADYDTLEKELAKSVGNILKAMGDGLFRPAPQSRCDRYCPAADICRFKVYGKGGNDDGTD